MAEMGPRRMKKLRYDLLLILGLLLAAAVMYLALRPGGQGAWAVVTVDGREVGRYPLSEDVTVTIGEADYNVLQITDGQATVIEANCGDHTCVRTGAVSREGETIVCLPHRLIVEIRGGDGSDFDATAG